MSPTEAATAQRARYYARKAARRCIGCNAGLQPRDGLFCVECEDRRAAYVSSAESIENRRARERQRQAALYRANPEAVLARQRAIRLARKLAGCCTICGQPAAEDSGLCAAHRESERVRIREVARRRRARERSGAGAA